MAWIKSDYKNAIEGVEKAMKVMCQHCEDQYYPGGCICNAYVALEKRLEGLNKRYNEMQDEDIDGYDF